MTGKPEQHSLEDVKRLLRSLEETTADDGQNGLQPSARHAPRRDAPSARATAGSPSPPGPRDPMPGDAVLAAPMPAMPISTLPVTATQQPGIKLVIGVAIIIAGIAAGSIWYFMQPNEDSALSPRPGIAGETRTRDPADMPRRKSAAESQGAGSAAGSPPKNAASVDVGAATKTATSTATTLPATASPLQPPAPNFEAPRRNDAPVQAQSGSITSGDPAAQQPLSSVPVPIPVQRASPIRDKADAAPKPSTATPSPSVRVATSVTAQAGQPAPFQIAVEPAFLLGTASVVLMSGLPQGARLSRGKGLQNGTWSVAVGELSDLTLTPAATDATGKFELVIELRSYDATLLATARTSLTIVPGPSPAAPAMADQTRSSETDSLALLLEGKRQLASGQVAAARLLLRRAADAGQGEAARLLGDTYDPAKLFALGVRGTNGDMEKAVYWYERADELGDPQAKARLLSLGSR